MNEHSTLTNGQLVIALEIQLANKIILNDMHI